MPDQGQHLIKWVYSGPFCEYDRIYAKVAVIVDGHPFTWLSGPYSSRQEAEANLPALEVQVATLLTSPTPPLPV